MALILNKVENHCTKVINFEKEGAVCRLTLKNGLFTIRNLDNIDHNPRPLSSYDAFHGIARYLSHNMPHMRTVVLTGPQRENFPGGTKVDTGPPNLIGPSKPYGGSCR